MRRIWTLVLVGMLAVAVPAASARRPALSQRGRAVRPAAVLDGGHLTESLGQADAKPLQASLSYAATRFPVVLHLRPGDPRWAGIQLHSGRFEFLQLEHMHTGP